jgi:Na+:H+ antiporter, NhaA family
MAHDTHSSDSASGRPSAAPGAPPETWLPLQRLSRLAVRPIERFLHVEAASGIVLLVATAMALGWANSRWSES